MENYGLIIRHLRQLEQLSLQATASQIGRSIGWLSEVENNSGESKLSEREFERIILLLDGAKHRPMFRTWVATYKNRERVDQTFDGAVLKFIRLKQGLSLKTASKRIGISTAQLSKIETGLKECSYETRNRIMIAYGYSPTSFKNLSSDPVRSKAVPFSYKLSILLNCLPDEQIEKIFQFALSTLQTNNNER